MKKIEIQDWMYEDLKKIDLDVMRAVESLIDEHDEKCRLEGKVCEDEDE